MKTGFGDLALKTRWVSGSASGAGAARAVARKSAMGRRSFIVAGCGCWIWRRRLSKVGELSSVEDFVSECDLTKPPRITWTSRGLYVSQTGALDVVNAESLAR